MNIALHQKTTRPDWIAWDLNTLIKGRCGPHYIMINLDEAARRKKAIHEQVRQRGYSLARIAAEAGVSPTLVTEGAWGRSRTGEQILAEFFGVPVEVLFPENWDPRSPAYEKAQNRRHPRTWKGVRRTLLQRLRLWVCRRLGCPAAYTPHASRPGKSNRRKMA